ncbi:unnamed protein product [Prunus armeniaca]
MDEFNKYPWGFISFECLQDSMLFAPKKKESDEDIDGKGKGQKKGKKVVQSLVRKEKKNMEDEKRKRIIRPTWNIKGLRYALQNHGNKLHLRKFCGASAVPWHVRKEKGRFGGRRRRAERGKMKKTRRTLGSASPGSHLSQLPKSILSASNSYLCLGKTHLQEGIEGCGKMERGVEISKGGCSDSGYLGGCERSSHRAPATESVHMSVEHMVSQSSDYNGVDMIAPRKEDVMGKEFKTIELAEEYYMSYAKGTGFSLRKDKLVRNSEGKVCRRWWCCSKEGLRNEKFNDRSDKIRPPKAITRENCSAHFWVGYEKKRDVYVVRNFEPHHNHQLLTPLESPYLRCNRVVRKSDLAQAVGMRRALFRTCQTYEYMVDQCGGYLNVGFQIKDLYNKLDASHREILLDGDTEAALCYLKAKGAMDPEFFCKFSVDEKNSLWRLLIFDSTYKTNVYDKPLVLFVGSNNYRSTVMVGCALLQDETLETFMASMKDKKPISILTDGDEAMRKAIDNVFPMSNHRLCSWHVSRNAQNNLKDDELLRNF